MKIYIYALVVGLCFLEYINAENDSIKEQLLKIKVAESSDESKKVITEFDYTRDAGLSLVVKRAIETENIDLLELIRRKIELVDWAKSRSWEEGLDLSSRYIEGLEVISKKYTSKEINLKSYFLSAPDVPYERVTDWHRGYAERGLQGSILKIMAENDAKSFQEVIVLLDKESISSSKKKTIAWAMRYDKSGFSERTLKEKIPKASEMLKPDFEDSLKFLNKVEVVQTAQDNYQVREITSESNHKNSRKNEADQRLVIVWIVAGVFLLGFGYFILERCKKQNERS